VTESFLLDRRVTCWFTKKDIFTVYPGLLGEYHAGDVAEYISGGCFVSFRSPN
jgi:hypothetical protein